MRTFVEQLPRLAEQVDQMERAPLLPAREFQSLLEKSLRQRLETEEVLALLRGTMDEANRRLTQDFAARSRRPHDREILLMPPLYFTSKCENHCPYCAFGLGSNGTRLSRDEFQLEVGTLLDMGYRSLELVSSQDKEFYLKKDGYTPETQAFDIPEVAAYFGLARKGMDARGGGMLTSNIPPVDRESLRKLRSAGLDCYLLWAETFHPRQYRALHRDGTPKENQAFRLASFEEAVEAGIPHLAGAFLKGLYDWRKEEALLYAFDRHLKSKSGRGFSIIGTPRLKGPFATSPLVKPYFVSDEDYELNIALDRILFDGVLWLQTREDPKLNRRLIDRYGAGVILTLDCSTAPGGYGASPKSRAQFPVYRQNLDEAVKELEDRGYRVIFGWDSQTLSGFQRQN